MSAQLQLSVLLIVTSMEKIDFADRITLLTGATWEMVPEAAMKDRLDRGYYDRERNIFCLSEACSGGIAGADHTWVVY